MSFQKRINYFYDTDDPPGIDKVSCDMLLWALPPCELIPTIPAQICASIEACPEGVSMNATLIYVQAVGPGKNWDPGSRGTFLN